MVWRCDCTKPPILNNQGRAETFEILSSPVFHDGRVYVTLGKDPGMSSKEKGRLVCMDATMEGDITEKGVIWKFDEIHASCSTATISDGLLYVADMLGKVYCLEAASGKVVWRHEWPARTAIWGSPLVADGKVYLGSRGKGLLVFAASREKRVIHDGGKLFVDVVPAVAGGVMYVAAHHALFAIGREQVAIAPAKGRIGAALRAAVRRADE
jgi:outer membrane protein assembly factor BamB